MPKLRARGIKTLAQAERACRKLASRIDTEAQAGWHSVSGAGGAEPRPVAEYARDALSLMMREQVSSVFVTPGHEEETYGIVTERDILRAIDTGPGTALGQTVATITKRPLVCVREDEFLYRAIGMMNAGNFRHLGVSGDGEAPVGALSARDLLKQRASDALSLADSIETARSAEDLGRIWADLTTVARGLVHEEVDPRDIAAVISRELRALTSRACDIAEQGNGSPPVPYAMLVLGSGGRGESLLAMDQDNAIVYTQGERDGETDKWSAALGKRVSQILNMAGGVLLRRRHHGVRYAMADAAVRLAGDDNGLGRTVETPGHHELRHLFRFDSGPRRHGARRRTAPGGPADCVRRPQLPQNAVDEHRRLSGSPGMVRSIRDGIGPDRSEKKRNITDLFRSARAGDQVRAAAALDA